jgi:hypothetical protein
VEEHPTEQQKLIVKGVAAQTAPPPPLFDFSILSTEQLENVVVETFSRVASASR